MGDCFACACAERKMKKKKQENFSRNLHDFCRNSYFLAWPPAALLRISKNVFQWSFGQEEKKFPHFFPAKGKKCFQNYPNHWKVEKYTQKQSFRRVASRNPFTILANLVADWMILKTGRGLKFGSRLGGGGRFCLCMLERGRCNMAKTYFQTTFET